MKVDHGAVALQLVLVQLQQVEKLLPPGHDLLLPLPDLQVRVVVVRPQRRAHRLQVEEAFLPRQDVRRDRLVLLHARPHLVQVGTISRIAQHLDHLVEVALPQHGLPFELVRELLELLLPEQLLLDRHLLAVLLPLQLLPRLLDVVGPLTLGRHVGRLSELLQLDLDVKVGCFDFNFLFQLWRLLNSPEIKKDKS